jgi:tRNA threonylcarbamoyladenosine biosynthesis protein TsaE
MSAFQRPFRSPDELRLFGSRLGALLRDGDVLALIGSLGAGKTTLTQGIAAGLDVAASSPVQSPTFALRHDHTARIPLAHVDLYRLASSDEADDSGVLDGAGEHGVTVVEWADRLPGAIPPHALYIRLEHAASGRLLTLWSGDGSDPSWALAEHPTGADGDDRWTAVPRPNPGPPLG